MKKLLLFAILLFSITASAQMTAELYVGKQQKIFLERTAVTENSVTFGYLESVYHGDCMFKAFHEQKFWETPVFIHAEYQTNFNGQNVYLIGSGLYGYLPNGFLELLPAYRYDGQHNWNVSFVYLLNWKYLEFYGYNHIWGQNYISFFGEERIHFKIGEHFRIGGAIDLAYFGDFTITPVFGLRYDF